MTTVAVTCIKNGRTDTFGRPLVSGTYYPEIDREHARSLWNSGFVSVADTSVFDDDPFAGTSPIEDYNVARSLLVSSNPAETAAIVASEMALVGTTLGGGVTYQLNALKSSIGIRMLDCSSLTGFSVDSGATMELVSVTMPEIGKPSGFSIKFTVPAGLQKQIFFPTHQPVYNPIGVVSMVLENLTVQGDVSAIWYAASAPYTAYFKATTNITLAGKRLLRPSASQWITGAGSPTWSTVTDGKLRVTAPATSDAVLIIHGVYAGGRFPPAVVLFNDDTLPGCYNYYAQLLDKYRLKSGFGVIWDSPSRITNFQLDELYNAGHDLHPHGIAALNTYQSAAAAISDIQSNALPLLDRGYTRGSKTYVYPSGISEFSATDRWSIVDYLVSAGYESAYVGQGVYPPVYKGIGRMRIGRRTMSVATTAAALLSDLDTQISRGEGMVITSHDVVASGGTGSDTNLAEMDALLSGIATRIAAGSCINLTPSQAIATWK